MQRCSRIVLQIHPTGRPSRLAGPIARSRKRPVRCARDDPDEVDTVSDEAEDRIARLEATARGRRASSPTEEPVEEATSNKRDWKEGEMFPEGWENLTIAEKAWQLYAGERGALFWANKIAFAAAIFVGIAWIFFRFVGPQLGLYELKSTLSS